MTTAQASEYTGLKPSRLRQLVRDGELKADRDETPRGPIYYFHKAELDRWSQERAEQAAQRRGRRGRPLKLPDEGQPS